MSEQSPEDTCSSNVQTSRTPSRDSSELSNALSIDLGYSPTWSLLAEATSDDPSPLDGTEPDPGGTAGGGGTETSATSHVDFDTQHINTWMDLLPPTQFDVFSSMTDPGQPQGPQHYHQPDHVQHPPRGYQEQRAFQWPSSRNHECPMHSCSEATALYPPYTTTSAWSSCLEKQAQQQRKPCVSQDCYDRAGEMHAPPLLMTHPGVPPVEPRCPSMPMPMQEKQLQDPTLFHPETTIVKSVLRTLLTGEGSAPYQYYKHQHQPVAVQATAFKPEQVGTVSSRSHFPEVINLPQVVHRQVQPVPSARPVQQLMSFERAFWQIGAAKNANAQVHAAPQLLPQPPLLAQLPQPPQPSRPEYYVVYPLNKLLPKQFVTFPPATVPGRVTEQYIDLTSTVQEVPVPIAKKRRYTTVRELLQARVRPPVPQTGPNVDHRSRWQQVTVSHVPRPQGDFRGHHQVDAMFRNQVDSEPPTPARRGPSSSATVTEPTAKSAKAKEKAKAKEHRPRHFALQALEIGTFKVVSCGRNDGCKNRFKIIFSRRKFLYEFSYGTDHRAVIVDVPFDSVVSLFAERDVLVVEVNAVPRLQPSGSVKRKMVDVTGGQLESCFLHKLVLGKPSTDKVKEYLTSFDSKFDVLLGIKPPVTSLSNNPINDLHLHPHPHPQQGTLIQAKFVLGTPYNPATSSSTVDVSSPKQLHHQVDASRLLCQCQSRCSLPHCTCVKGDSRCFDGPSGCGCKDCNNPFNTLAESGVDLSMSSSDHCLMYNVRQMTGLMVKTVLESEVLMGCCNVHVKVKTLIPGLRKCPNASCQLKPLYQFSWCRREICRQDEAPRNHCHVCHGCKDQQTKHCQTCKKCVRTSGVLGLHCSNCGSYCGKDPNTIFSSIFNPKSQSPPTEISD